MHNYEPIGELPPDQYLMELAKRRNIYGMLISTAQSSKELLKAGEIDPKVIEWFKDNQAKMIANELYKGVRREISEEYVLKFVSGVIDSI